MTLRAPQPDDTPDRRSAANIAPSRARLLIIAANADSAAVLTEQVVGMGYRAAVASGIDDAHLQLGADTFDVLLVDDAVLKHNTDAAIKELDSASRHAKTIVMTGMPEVTAAVTAIRAGACDVITTPADSTELAARIEHALKQRTSERRHERKIAKLRRVCRELNRARHEVNVQLDELCQDLVAAYQEMAEHADEAAMAAEFRTLLSQELDVEDLLRTALEYLLVKTGPTNAAVFLPGSGSEFGLGAYVNYECSRDSIGYLLDHLGEAVCPQIIEEPETVRFDDASQFADWLGVDDTGVLTDSQVIAFSCRHEDQCMAIVVLFRRDKPFDVRLAEIIEVLRPIFAAQIAQVIRVHRRGRAEWPDDVHDGADFNDESDFGPGGMAA